MFKSLKSLLLFEFIALAIAPLVFATTLIIWHNYNDFITSQRDTQNEISKQLAIQLSSFYKEVKNDLDSVNRYRRIMALSREEQYQILSILLAKRSLYIDLLLLDGKGREVLFLSNNEKGKEEKSNVLSADYASLLTVPGTCCYLSAINFENSTGEPFMTVGVPLKGLRTGLPEGVLLATVRLKLFWEIIAGFTLQDGSDLYVLDNNNRLIAHRNPSFILRKIVFDLDSNAESIVQRGLNGTRSIVAYNSIKIGEQSFKVVAEKSLFSALTTLFNGFLLVILIILLTLTGAICLAFLTFRQIIQPLETVSQAVLEIKEGNLKKRLVWERKDEIGTLSQSINVMAEKLQKSHEELEKKVQDRTKELVASNKELQININERLQVEQELQKKQIFLNAVLENVEDAVIVCNDVGVLSLFNRAGREIHGLPEKAIPADEWAEHYDLYNADGKTMMRKEDIPLFQAFQGKHVRDIEMVIAQKQGEKRVLLASGQPFYDSQGKRLGAVATMHDITEQKLTEKELKEIHQKLEIKVAERTTELKESYEKLAKEVAEKEAIEGQLRQAQKLEAIGTLAGGIAHDFNNILSAILGYAQIVRSDLPNNSKSAKNIDQVIMAGNRATELVKQILTFSRKTEQQKQPLRISLIVNEALQLLRSTIPTTIDIQASIAKEGDLVLADPVNIHQVVVNLCTNASQAIGNEKGKLEVILEHIYLDPEQIADQPTAQAGPFVRLTVKDSGVGMDKETMKRIFEPYFTTKKPGEGTGLGLAVLHGIVAGCNGFIKVDSTLGKGTVIQVFLPTVEEEQTATTNKKEHARSPTGNENILYVDDEPAIIHIGKSILTRLGYNVTTSTSSIEALKKFQENPQSFDLVITDQTMPYLAGIDLVKAMLKLKPGLPIILCSGYTSAFTMDEAYSLGIKKFIMKPFDKEALAEAVRCALDEA